MARSIWRFVLKIYQYQLQLQFLYSDESQLRKPDDLGEQFTEIFMKRLENVTLLLSLLEVNYKFVFQNY